MPRPNSRVEIVTAMRRIRVSVARLLLPLPHPTAWPSPLCAPAAFSCINPVLQCIHNSVFPSLCCHLRVTWARCLQAWCGTESCLQPGVPRGTRVSHVLWLPPGLCLCSQHWDGLGWKLWDVRLPAPGGTCSVSMIGIISSFVSPSNKVTTSYLCKSFSGVLLLCRSFSSVKVWVLPGYGSRLVLNGNVQIKVQSKELWGWPAVSLFKGE